MSKRIPKWPKILRVDNMLEIEIETVSQDEQRYNALGDWVFDYSDLFKVRLTINVTNLGNWYYEALIALHELVEAMMCAANGVSQEDVDNFDTNFKGKGEPGDDPSAPYHKQHMIANVVERLISAEMFTPQEYVKFWGL